MKAKFNRSWRYAPDCRTTIEFPANEVCDDVPEQAVEIARAAEWLVEDAPKADSKSASSKAKK